MAKRPSNEKLYHDLVNLQCRLRTERTRLKNIQKYLPNEQRSFLAVASKDINDAMDEIGFVLSYRELEGVW